VQIVRSHPGQRRQRASARPELLPNPAVGLHRLAVLSRHPPVVRVERERTTRWTETRSSSPSRTNRSERPSIQRKSSSGGATTTAAGRSPTTQTSNSPGLSTRPAFHTPWYSTRTTS
jgi:hypothetical protein